MNPGIYNEAIRDLVPEQHERRGYSVVRHVAGPAEHRTRLLEQLLEMALDCWKNPTLEKLANLREMGEAAAAACGFELNELIRMQRQLAETYGGFAGRVVLEGIFEGAEVGGKA